MHADVVLWRIVLQVIIVMTMVAKKVLEKIQSTQIWLGNFGKIWQVTAKVVPMVVGELGTI